ncbi:MAG TPA: FixH family protein [Polyangia bacterium]
MSIAAKRSLHWPIAIVGIIALHATGMVAVIAIATRNPSFSVEPDHYQKALGWDRLAARKQASDLLGWKAEVVTDAQLDGNKTRRLDCRILDHEGKPVTGATVAVLAFPHARGEERVHMDLHEAEAGVYSARAPMARAGLWELRLSALRGPDLFTTTLMHSASTSP